MFGLSKKISSVLAPLSGTAVSLEEVPDEVFSMKMLGPGLAILPSDNIILAPFDGVLVQSFDTFHAYSFKSDDGIEILMHIGIDTVELRGDGFETFITSNQKIKAGEKIGTVDISLLIKKGYKPHTPVIILNENSVVNIGFNYGEVKAGNSTIFTYKLKR